MTTTNKTKIKKLSSKDYLQYKEIRLATLEKEPDAFSTTYKEALEFSDGEWKDILENENNNFFMAQSNSKPVGILRVSTNDRKAVPDAVVLGGLYVDENHRRLGIASDLMSKALDFSKKSLNSDLAQLWVRETQTAAIGLYKKFGFDFITRFGDSMDGRKKGEQELTMEKHGL